MKLNGFSGFLPGWPTRPGKPGLRSLGFLLLFFISGAFAGVPKLINFQGVLRDAGGNPVANGSFGVTFRIYDAPAGGNLLWSETQSVATTNGLFSILLGAVSPVPDSAFKDTSRYLGITVSPDPEMTPRQQLVSVGYGYRVSSVDGAAGGTIISKVSIGPGHTNTGANAFVAGQGNTASGNFSTVGGGARSIASGAGSTVSGGDTNIASSDVASVGGGKGNIAGNQASTIAGGYFNVVSGYGATVAGGAFNKARGQYSVVSGGGNVFSPADSNSALADWSTVSGGRSNVAGGSFGAVAGGCGNKAIGSFSNISGGLDNMASNQFATVGGGHSNIVGANWATIGGGNGNTAGSENATIGGGSSNDASGSGAVVAGGAENSAGSTYSTVGGGVFNLASNIYSTIGGGESNNASGSHSTISGGYSNAASGFFATVSGGSSDTADGQYSIVAGGRGNKAGSAYSFAAGRRAKANHAGTFVWADSTDADFTSTGANQFLIRASGGVGVGTNNPNSPLHVNGPIATAVTTVAFSGGSGNFNVDASHSILFVRADENSPSSFTVTLPAPTGVTGRQYTIKRIDASSASITIQSAAGLIDGTGTKTLNAQYKYLVLVSDGDSWFIVANN